MDTHNNMIIANNRIITPDILSLKYNSDTRKYDITLKNEKTYSYNYNNVKWLKDPEVLNLSNYRLSCNGQELYNIKNIYRFHANFKNYLHICFENKREKSYEESSLKIEISSLTNTVSKDVLEYFKQVSAVVSLRSDDGTKLLSKQYEKIQFLSTDNALSTYLNPQNSPNKKLGNSVPIFPFGCNASQFKAVKSALDNKISVIEGPPGTGKTQTILNIIANLLIQGKTVQVVSNNNAATANILEKLSLPTYNMGFLVAFLGNTDNKAEFIDNQPKYPDMSSWDNSNFKNDTFFKDIAHSSLELNDVFQKQECLAIAKQEQQAMKTEIKYFKQYSNGIYKEPYNIKIRKKLNLEKIIKVWQGCEQFSEKQQKLSFFFKLKTWLFGGISDWDFLSEDIGKIIPSVQSLFYTLKYEEITSEISNLENELSDCNAQKMADNFIEISMRYLKGILFKKYGNSQNRTIFTLDDLWKNPSKVQQEYPITLSTTFSSRSSLTANAEFDYLIMDEASQVDVTTGALALSCAKNVVIVGDTKQLPNVINEPVKEILRPIFECFQINEGYNYVENSFLQSICKIIPDIPKTLLREHYRCHPKIINFCNQKFYNNNLIIMSKDNGEKDVISVVKTNVGNHTRDAHINQRQIDVINQEILPILPYKLTEIGIIAPYNKQVNTMRDTLRDQNIDVATVHKFQGREKDAIILSTVDDEITDFADDPYLLNVAVSRAKNRLCIVVSGNKLPKDSNIADLINYIEYNNFSITESNIYSVFDYLYSQYTEIRLQHLKKYKKISEFNSENLMYALITDILKASEYSTLRVICHQPLNMLIRNPKLLNDDEYKYAMHHATHLDFLIYNCISKKPVLAIEVDGFYYHKQGTIQARRDKMKNRILDLYEIPLLRLATNASGEKEKIITKLNENF